MEVSVDEKKAEAKISPTRRAINQEIESASK